MKAMKTAFLVAKTSVWGIQALMAGSPYAEFHRDRVTLRLDLKFLPMIVSDLHLNHLVHLPVSSPNHSNQRKAKLQSFNVARAISY